MLLKRLKSLALNAIPNRGVKHSLENNLHHKNLLIVITFRGKGWGQEGDDKREMAFDFHVFNPLYSEFHNSEQVILFGKKTQTSRNHLYEGAGGHCCYLFLKNVYIENEFY